MARASRALRGAESARRGLGEACGRYRLAKAVDMAGYGGRAGGLEATIAGPSPLATPEGSPCARRAGIFCLRRRWA